MESEISYFIMLSEENLASIKIEYKNNFGEMKINAIRTKELVSTISRLALLQFT